MDIDARAAILLRAADLLAGPWRARINAATMLGQAKTAYQAEIDSACELADFWRFNVHFARQMLTEQPIANARGIWNRTDHRPLEGFVYAVTPFNFTAIAGNLPTAPALMGNVVVWKPSMTQQLAASLMMDLLQEAGLPDGVINMLPGHGPEISEVVLAHPDLAGIHFTGSTRVFQQLWSTVGANIAGYRSYPRLVGETGGKDFVVAHPSADLGRAAHRAGSRRVRILGAEVLGGLPGLRPELVVDPAARRPGRRNRGADDRFRRGFRQFHQRGDRRPRRSAGSRRPSTARRRRTPSRCWRAARYDDSVGYFVRPTLLVGTDPRDDIFCTEYFGPILSIHVYPDDQFGAVLTEVDQASPYALTGSIIARDRSAVERASDALRYTAGNFYINDKPTGAVVGQQPFGGARASGTNDKAGSAANLMRWTSPRSIKETFVAPTAVGYPHQRQE